MEIFIQGDFGAHGHQELEAVVGLPILILSKPKVIPNYNEPSETILWIFKSI